MPSRPQTTAAAPAAEREQAPAQSGDGGALDRLDRHHQRTRERGVNGPLLFLAHLTLKPLIIVFFRLLRHGRRHIPRHGGVILASNHRSFLDPFAIGCCTWRPVYFMAKQELFDRRLIGWLLNALGAFPVRRGESDEQAMETARVLLERGEVLVLFPEGTRIRRGALRRPRRGMGRLALETGVPIAPIAIAGSERARRGWLIKPVRVRLRVGRALTFPRVESPSPRLAAEVSERVWPCVQLQWEWLGGLPALRTAAVVGAGSMGTAIAVVLARAGLDVELACRRSDQAERVRVDGRNADYLPGVELPDGVRATTTAEVELGGADLVVLAVPTRELPQVVGQIGAQIGTRSAVLVLSKGLVAPLATRPVPYVEARVKARAVASLGGAAHAGEAVELGAGVIVGCSDADLRTQLCEVLDQGGLEVDGTDDVVGVELGGCAKNTATLAAAAAAPTGMNAAGAIAGQVFAEVHELATRSGARPETLAGLAGVGDLIGTALAAGSRNRRAGELLADGVSAADVPEVLGCAAEAIDFVPLLVDELERAEVAAPATDHLLELIEGRLSPQEWLESVPGGRRRRDGSATAVGSGDAGRRRREVAPAATGK
jgi:glycerol-3-phosphate dehydrogenase (NAD(P)+)